MISAEYRLGCVCACVLLGCLERISCIVTTVETDWSLPTWPGTPEPRLDRWLVPSRVPSVLLREASLDSRRTASSLVLWTTKRQAEGHTDLHAEEARPRRGVIGGPKRSAT